MNLEHTNTILYFFYDNSGIHELTREHFKGINEYPIIDTLIEDGLLRRKITDNGHKAYGITLNGRIFMKGLPLKFKDNPYGYFIKNKHFTIMVSEATLLKYFYKQDKEISIYDLMEKYEANDVVLLKAINYLLDNEWLERWNDKHDVYIISEEGKPGSNNVRE